MTSLVVHVDLASRLKQATRAAHQRLDHHPLLASLVRPGVREEDYARALAALYAPLASLEDVVLGLGLPPLLTPRTPVLRHDLSTLGFLPWAYRGERPRWASLEEGVAACYLLEGSGMGATAIYRILRKAAVDWPMDYFALPNAAERWQTLWQWIATLPALDAEKTCATANAMFGFLSRHMEDCEDYSLLPVR